MTSRRLAAIARERDLWVISDEAYEDVVFDGEHVSIASLPGMYARTIPLYTFSKSYAMTGLRLGYVAVARRRRCAIARRRSSSTPRATSRRSCSSAASARSKDRRTASTRSAWSCARGAICSTAAWRELAGGVFSGEPPAGAFYAFLRSIRVATTRADAPTSLSWAMAEFLIKNGRIGCVPGVDFGANGEGYVRFCFARDRRELTGALQSMKQLFGVTV